MPTRIKSKKEAKADEPKPMKDSDIQESVAEEEREELDVLEFLQAVDEFKRKTNTAFPTWSEILEIVKSLGYRKKGR